MDKEEVKGREADTPSMAKETSEQGSSRLPWVKPVFEREALKSALSNPTGRYYDGLGSES